MEKEKKEQYFKYFYSNPFLSYFQNWGHKIIEKNIRNGNLILDMGCGAFDHIPFSQPNKAYIELDLDFNVIQIGKKKYPKIPSLCANAETMPFKSNVFSNIISVFNLEHIFELKPCVKELCRILNKNGRLIAAIPTEGFLFKLGRRFTSARFAMKNLGVKNVKEYEAIVAKNHVNDINKIFSEVRTLFTIDREYWSPFGKIGGKFFNINVAFIATPRK